MLLSDEAKKARAAYQKQWRENNPDKAKEIRRRFWEKKAREVAMEEEKSKEIN